MQTQTKQLGKLRDIGSFEMNNPKDNFLLALEGELSCLNLAPLFGIQEIQPGVIKISLFIIQRAEYKVPYDTKELADIRWQYREDKFCDVIGQTGVLFTSACGVNVNEAFKRLIYNVNDLFCENFLPYGFTKEQMKALFPGYL